MVLILKTYVVGCREGTGHACLKKALAQEPEAAFSSCSSSALHEGEQTAWDLPRTLRVPIKERALCLPHMKHDIVAAPNEVVAANGEPDTLDL
jgi:hypothetical protein